MPCLCSLHYNPAESIFPSLSLSIITNFGGFFYIKLWGQRLGEDENKGEKSRSVNLNGSNK
jgi:hypothetical protein